MGKFSDKLLTNKLTTNVLDICDEIPLSIYQSSKLKHILKRTFLVQLYTRHQNTMIPLNNWVN